MVRRLSLIAMAAFGLSALPGARAAEQLVTGTVAPEIGIGLDSAASPTSTAPSIVVREQRGDTLFVTVMPAG